MIDDPTMGAIARAAEAASPRTIRIGEYVIRYVGAFDLIPREDDDGEPGSEPPC